MIKPLAFRLLVELVAKPGCSRGGVHLPETIIDNRPLKGVILAKGPKAEDLEVGEAVFFDKDTRLDIEVDGKMCCLVDSRALIAKVEP